MQTRSADEPMTTFVLCNECGNRWKVGHAWVVYHNLLSLHKPSKIVICTRLEFDLSNTYAFSARMAGKSIKLPSHVPIDVVVIELFPLLFFQKSSVCLLLILINLILENIIEFYMILGFILGILVGLVLVW